MTAVLLVLFACNTFYSSLVEAKEPPTCPDFPRLKTCPVGLANQCTKDLDCPTFTRCCWDGCYKRCVDTTSKIAINSRNKYGTCPRHSMQDPCAASFDLCLDDSYCLGDEKCCMDTDCGKKCMLPKALTTIKNSTRAFYCPHVKSHKGKCPEKPSHQCALDSECPTTTTCCFDGCSKRCTDKKGKIVPNRKGSSCPLFPPPAGCPVSFKECQNDEECSFTMKCCSDTCNYWCMPSIPHRVNIPDPVVPDPDIKERNLYKPGKCPTVSKPESCDGQVFQCNYDVDCWDSSKKCCDNGCVTKCVDPVLTSTHPPEVSTSIATPKTTIKTDSLTTHRTTLRQKPKTTFVTTERTTQRPTTKPTPVVVVTTENITPGTSLPTPPRTDPVTITSQKITNRPTTYYRKPKTTERRHTQLTVVTQPKILTTIKTRPPIKDGVTVYPKSYDAVIGESVQAVCYVKGEPFEGWYDPKGLKITTTKGNVYVFGNGDEYTLVIVKVEDEYGGKYTCRGAFASDTYDLTVQLAIDASKGKTFLRSGTTGMVGISVQGFPKPKCEWIKDYEPIDLKSGRYALTPSGSLIIKDVKMSDKGIYSVAVSSVYMKNNGLFNSMVARRMDADVIVDIIGEKCPMPKKTTSCPLDVKDECLTDRDCSRSSGCCSDGCKNTCIEKNEIHKDEAKSGYCPTLLPPDKCPSTTKECSHDKHCHGDQKCCSDSCTLRCHDPKSVSLELIPGVQTYPPAKTMCNPKQRIRLVCRIDKQPFEGWFDSYGRKILPKTHGSKMYVEDHGIYQVLVINNVTAKDGGKYVCQGAFDNAGIYLNVNRTIDNYDHPMMLHPGKSGLILQNVQCYPLPRFVWYKRGRPLDLSSHRYSISPSGSLGIRRVRSIDMGLYTLKISEGGKMLDTGIKVAAAVEGVDFTEWQESFAPGASVRCLKDTMYIDLEKKVMNGYSELDLTLRNSSCRATSNQTHYTLKAPLVGCGTEAKFTEEAVVYSNMVKEYRKNGMITRIQDIRVPFSCFYTKEGVTSTFGLLPTKVRKIMDGGNATTRFELGMSLYRDKSYSLSYGIGDFPLKVTVNRPLYVQVSIDSPDKRLSVIAERCYATPTQSPDHVMQYDIINDGCGVDPTVQFYKGSYNIQRFSFKAFQFIAKGKQFVYLHCHLIVCNASNTMSRCSQGCLSNFGRLRREASSSTEVDLTQGPFILESRPKALKQKSIGSSFDKYVWIMVGMAGFCIVCLIIMIYMKKQINDQRKMPQPDPDRETNV